MIWPAIEPRIGLTETKKVNLKRDLYSICFFLTFLAMSILIAPRRACGWGNTWMGANLEQIVNSARWKAGLLRYSMALSFNSVGYDSDIYFGETATRVPDFTLRTGVPFRLFLPIKKKIVFDISENPEYVFLLKTKKERALNNDFGGYLHLLFGRVYFRGEAKVANVRQRLSPELTVPIRQKKNDLGGLVLFQVSSGTSVALQYRSSTYKYDNPPDGSLNISETLNQREDSFNFTAHFQQASKTRLFLAGQYRSYTFTQAPSRFKDTRSYGIYGGVEFLPSLTGRSEDKGIQGTINLGYRHFNILDPQLRDYSGLVGNTSVSIGVFKLTSVRGFFSRDIQFSASSSLAYYIFTSYGGGVSRRLSRRSRLEYDLSFGRGTYPTGFTGGATPQNALLRYTYNSLSLSFQLRQDLEISLLASLGNRGGYAAVPGGKRYFVGFGLIYGVSAGGVPMLASPFS